MGTVGIYIYISACISACLHVCVCGRERLSVEQSEFRRFCVLKCVFFSMEMANESVVDERSLHAGTIQYKMD